MITRLQIKKTQRFKSNGLEQTNRPPNGRKIEEILWMHGVQYGRDGSIAQG